MSIDQTYCRHRGAALHPLHSKVRYRVLLLERRLGNLQVPCFISLSRRSRSGVLLSAQYLPSFLTLHAVDEAEHRMACMYHRRALGMRAPRWRKVRMIHARTANYCGIFPRRIRTAARSPPEFRVRSPDTTGARSCGLKERHSGWATAPVAATADCFVLE